MSPATGPLPYAEYFQRVGSDLVYAIDWSGFLAVKWRPRAEVDPGTTIRVGNGYAFTSVAGGFSGSLLPVWPQTLGATVNEGSVQWVCVPIDDTSLAATLSNAVWTAPEGIAISLQQIEPGQLATVGLDCTGATAGTNYPVICAASFSDGESETGEILLKVR